MKISTAVIAAVATTVVAGRWDGVPQCGIQCITSGVERIGCDINDRECPCTEDNQSKLASDLEMVNCLTYACNPTDISDTISAGNKLCAAVSGATGTTTTKSASGTAASSAGLASGTGSSSGNGVQGTEVSGAVKVGAELAIGAIVSLMGFLW